MRWFIIKAQIVRFIAWMTFGKAVYVKDRENDRFYVRIARTSCDPFENDPTTLWIRINKVYRKLNNDGTIGYYDTVKWRFVSKSLHAAEMMKRT